MIDVAEWNKAIIMAADYCGKNIRVTMTDGTNFEGVCKGYSEDENSNGETCSSLIVGWKIFLQEDVEKIEFIDP